MMNKLIFGRYMPGDSLIHRLDPRAKLLASFYFIGIIFLANNWETYLVLAVFTLFSVFLSKVDLKFFYPRYSPIDLADPLYCSFANLVHQRRRNLLELGCFPYH